MNAEVKPTESDWGREERAQIFAALGDPLRLAVVELLHDRDLSPDALCDELGISGNLLAHHLKVLESAGLVERMQSKNDRRRTYVRAVPGSLTGLLNEHPMMSVPRVVFVCTHNSARSVLADAIWHEMSDVPSASAGTHPAQAINPGARAAARRHGLALRSEHPQLMSSVVRPRDLVVSVCDSVNEELGDMPNPRLHWSIPDPAADGTSAAFDAAVRELQQRVAHLAPHITHSRRKKVSA